MVYINNIYWCFLCFIYFKELESTKIYVVKIADLDGTGLSNNNDETLTKKLYNNAQDKVPHNYVNRHKILVDKVIQPDYEENGYHTFICNLYGNKQIKCIKKVKIKQRSNDFDLFERIKQLAYPIYTIYNPNVEKKPRFVDLTRLAQDSVDVENVERTNRVSLDYIDINDFRSDLRIRACDSIELDELSTMTDIKCIPVTRKAGISIEHIKDSNFLGDFKPRASSSSSDSSESSENIKIKGKRVQKRKVPKPKRFQVVNDDGNTVASSDDVSDKNMSGDASDKNISNESGSSDDSDLPLINDVVDDDNVESDLVENENIERDPVENDRLGDSDSESEESDIIEKQKRHKSKMKQKMSVAKNDDKYVFLQGNKYYDQHIKSYDDFRRGNRLPYFRRGNRLPYFRRGNRLPYFLPKRVYWKEDDYHRLGYFWFNGPKGKYIRPGRD